jgi:hypothetical protein
MLRMLEHAVAARTSPQRVCRVLSLVARSAICLTGPRGDAEKTARRILQHSESIPASLPPSPRPEEVQPCCP